VFVCASSVLCYLCSLENEVTIARGDHASLLERYNKLLDVSALCLADAFFWVARCSLR
jgi:hypothetical protein